MNYENYKKSRNAAWEILLACNVEKLPVDLNAVLRHLEVRVYSYSRGRELLTSTGLAEVAKQVSGLTFYIGSQPVILYNDAETPQRIRFTVGHELGHIVLGHVQPGEYTQQNREPQPGDSPTEQAANRFAADLLSPACVLWGLDLHRAEDIAKVCKISIQSARFRAERMEVLYQRNKFLLHPLEQAVYQQFEPFIKEGCQNPY